jgi:hypothetical protein
MGAITPSTTVQLISNVSAGQYWTFTAAACTTYYFSFCAADGGASGGWNTQITIDDNTGNSTGVYNDNYCGVGSYLSWTPTLSGDYRIYVTKSGCLNAGGSGATMAYWNDPLYTATAEYALVGSAVAISLCASLTSNIGNQTGCAWDINSTMNFASSFSYDFSMNLGTNDAGADGMAFVIQNDPRGLCACGSSGGQLGAGGISKSVIVEIDTYLNYEDRDDGLSGVICSGGPDPDHIDLWLNGNVNPTGVCTGPTGARIIPAAIPFLSGSTNYNIENGLEHTFRVSWVPGSPVGTLTVTILDATAVMTYAIVSYSFDPLVIFGTTTPYFGFTGSTGALENKQTICFPPVLLPVELNGFSATCLSSATSIIEWETESEMNNEWFAVERSTDDMMFTEITRLKGAGTTYIPHHYQWADEIQPGREYYYRLATIDYNGNKSFSKVISLSCNGGEMNSCFFAICK